MGVQDFRLDSFRRNVLTIAGAAKLHKLPTVLTGSYVEGPNGPIMRELTEMFPDAPTILPHLAITSQLHAGTGMSAPHSSMLPNFVKAVEGLGARS